MTAFGFATLGVLALYLALFFAASDWAARAAGRPVWLFGRAAGRDRLAALGFRAAFGLAFFGPLMQTAVPALHRMDPLWLEPDAPLWSLPGHFVAIGGAMLAWAGQIAMGASWRVGVAKGAVGELVTEGLYRLSRNPVFAGQLLLLVGVALAVPAVPTVLAALLFWLSARGQIESEERLLEERFQASYRAYRSEVPRWIGWPHRAASRPTERMVYRRWAVLAAAAAALAIDQASKWVILTWVMQPPRVIELLPVLNLTLGFNEGSAFGLLGGVMAGRPLVMTALTAAITAAVLVLALRARTSAGRVGFGLVVGGSLGNIADRLRHGAVTDFLDLHWQGWHWPTFNLADVAIVVGVAVLLVAGALESRRAKEASLG